MFAFVQKPTAAGQSSDASLLSQRSRSTAPPSARAARPRGHDFSRMAVHPRAPLPLQAKLAISAPGDRYEQEADRMADSVMSGTPGPLGVDSGGAISRGVQPRLYRQELCPEDMVDSMPSPGGGLESAVDEDKPAEEVQRKAKGDRGGDAGVTPSGFEQGLAGSGQGGAALPDTTRAFMEKRFGYDFSSVRIHHDTQANSLAKDINARAFTVDSSIYFGRSEYQPHSRKGRHLLAHELTHVVQQGEGRIARQVQRQTDCSDYPGYDSTVGLRTYNCAGLALRTYAYTAPPQAVYDAIAANFVTASSPAGGSCGPAEVKFWLWEYDLRFEDDTGAAVPGGGRDFHIVGGQADLSGADPTDVYSKNGARNVYGPASGPSWRPPARARALSNDPSETPGTHRGRPVYKIRSNFSEAITCAQCHP